MITQNSRGQSIDWAIDLGFKPSLPAQIEESDVTVQFSNPQVSQYSDIQFEMALGQTINDQASLKIVVPKQIKLGTLENGLFRNYLTRVLLVRDDGIP